MKFYHSLCIVLLSLLLTSCFSLYGVATYDLNSVDNLGKVSKKNMSVQYDGFDVYYSPTGELLIQNKSKAMMHVDLGESYVLDKYGQATRIFSNSVTSKFNAGTGGASVALGPIAGALGAKGNLANILNGVSVNGSKTNGTSVQYTEERYISIPSNTNMLVKFTNLSLPYMTAKKNAPIHYEEKGSPVVCGHILSYTFNPDAKDWKSVRNQFYLQDIVKTKGQEEAEKLANSDASKVVVKRDNYIIGVVTAAVLGLGIAAIVVL